MIPKLASAESLFQTVGYRPFAIAFVQEFVQLGGRVWPMVTLPALLSYTLRLTTRLLGENMMLS